MTETFRAKRGDLVAVVTRRSSVSIEAGWSDRERVELRYVSGVTREGFVRLTRSHDYMTVKPEHEAYANPQYLVIPASTLTDPEAVMDAYRDHLWRPESEVGYRQVKPFDSVDECRDFVRPFRWEIGVVA